MIALLAIFYPQITKYLSRPKFFFELISIGNPPGQIQSIYVGVTNVGKSVAHGLVGIIEVIDQQGKDLIRERIPIRKEIEIYDGVPLYPMERVLFLCMLNGFYKAGLPYLMMITSAPFKWGGAAIPPLTSMRPSGTTESEKYIVEGSTYTAKIFVGSEDLSRMSKYSFNFSYREGKIDLSGQKSVE
jgi:hypothetical protein